MQNIQESIGKILLKTAGEKLAGFAFNQVGLDKLLGDDTGGKLDELKAQLDRISAQVETLQSSVNQVSADLTKLALEGFTVPLGQTVSEIKSLYMDFYAPATRALTSYVAKDLVARNAGSTCSDTAECADARRYFEDLRHDFVQQFINDNAASLNTDLHDALVPGVAGSSVMSAWGSFLLKGPGSTGLLTAEDSDRVLGFYNYFAEYEALASWMKAQWDGIRFEPDPAEFTRFVDEQIDGYQKKEQEAVPARIPDNAVISLPADSALRTSTRHVQMWLTVEQIQPDLKWDPSSPTARGSVGEAVNTLNTTAAGAGYKDWAVPSKGDLDSLFSGRSAVFPGTTAATFLAKIAPTGTGWSSLLKGLSGKNPYLWSSEVAGIPNTGSSPAITCLNKGAALSKIVGTMTGYTHTAWGPAGASLSGYPSGYTLTNIPMIRTLQLTANDPNDTVALNQCKAQLAATVTTGFERGAAAQLLATRTTGDVNYLP